MKYDDASWHYDGNFPGASPQEFGGTHIGLFLRWCFLKGFAGAFALEHFRAEVTNVIKGTMTGTDYLFSCCDGKLTDEDLNDEGNAFADHYYGENGEFLTDYGTKFSHLLYVASEKDHDFAAFAEMVDQKFLDWQKAK